MADPEIQELDAQTVERIAAGEVVERPASVVKELVENSIDAGASRVTVAVESGGADGIRVTDDGVGMTETQLRRAVEKHTTSKIADIDDLEAGVSTLGFRGEALHAIGAVSRTTITSRPRDGGRGTELTVEGGEVTGVSPAGCPAGTTVEVTDLFYNVPARRKYLKQDSTEFAHVNTVATSYALANPDVAVTLEHDGRETFATTGTGDLRETILSVYGREVAESMRRVDGADLPAGPLESVEGLVSHPETNRASREYLSTFVNGRYVTANAVREAIVEAYGNQLAPDRYPFAVLSLTVDPGTVDVNVHPRKLEVRFADEDGMRSQVSAAVEQSLRDEGILRSSAPRGQSAPEQATIDPTTTDDEGQDSAASRPDAPSDSPASVPDSSGGGRATASGTDGADSTEAGTTADGLTTDDKSQSVAESGHESTGSSSTPSSSPRSADSDTATDRSEPATPPVEAPSTQQTLQGEEAHTQTAYETVPDLRVLGQLSDTYIVAEADDGLVLVDQHAADERINYERLTETFAGDTTTQALAEPVAVELTAREAELFETYENALARLGFQASRTAERHIEVTTVPDLLADAGGPELVREILDDLVTGESAAEQTVESVVDDLLADMACYPSITGNTSLTDGSIVDLLSALDDCENPWACPHGRPVLIHLDSEEIENRFERDYPGHQ